MVNSLLRKSRLPAGFLTLLALGNAVASAILFSNQVVYREPFGDHFRDQPGAWPHLFGHLLRMALSAWLAWHLWQYLRAAKQLTESKDPVFVPLFRALRGWWNALAISTGLLLAYGACIVLLIGPPQESNALSPRYQPSPFESSQRVVVEFRLAETEPFGEEIETTFPNSNQSIYLHEEPLLTNADIVEARVVRDSIGAPAISVRFTEEAGDRVAKATANHRHRPMAVLIDGIVVMAPTILAPIGGSVVIEGEFTEEEANRIAKGMTGSK
jgi:hypothetical protein